MPIALTSQEKKVLGFIAVMVVLGLVVLGIRKFVPGAATPPAAATPEAVHSIP